MNPNSSSVEEPNPTSPSVPGWQEVNATFPTTAGYAGVGFYYENPVYVRPGQKIGFEMNGLIYGLIDAKFDGGPPQQVSGPGSNDFAVFDHPWTSAGVHSMEMTVVDEYGDPNVHSYTVYVAPAADRGFYNGGNRMIVWEDGDGTLDNPFLVVEGFDPANENNVNLYYQNGKILFDEARNLGQDMIVLNFADGGADMASNAQVLTDAINYIDNIKSGSTPIKLAGVSMGGVIARYALAKAEENGSSLNVSHFASIDSPQQGAVLDRNLQDYLEDKEVGGVSLTSPAAKQLLQYNAFDPDRGTNLSAHSQFYSELDGLDGNGYPEDSKNIGVSFAPDTPNPNAGKWLTVNLDVNNILVDFNLSWENFYMASGDPIKKAGSYLPSSTTMMWGAAPAPFYADALLLYLTLSYAEFEVIRHEDPTFIPHESALDLDWSGNSKFDVPIFSSTPGYHNKVPQDIVSPLLQEMGVGTPSLPPSAPQNFEITSEYSEYYDHPVSMEWDMVSSAEKYEVYRCRAYSISNSCYTSWTLLTTSYGTSATDASLYVDDGSWGDGAAVYRVKAVNTAGASSPSSEEAVWVKDPYNQYSKLADEARVLALPDEFGLDQSTPNPGRGTVTIRYALPESSEVSLVVYDVMGREISRLVGGTVQAGFHDVQFDAADLTSGVYFYRMKAGDFTGSGSMVVVK